MTIIETNKIENRKKSRSRRTEQKTNKNETISEDLVPNGGWKIAFAMILILFTTMGPGTTKLIFNDFLEASGQAGLALSLSASLFIVTFSMADSLTYILSKRYSFQFVGFVGACLFSASNIFLTFVKNIHEWIFVHFLLGFGFGLMFTVTNTVFNTYFVNERMRHKMFNACHVIIGFSKIIFPQLVDKLLTLYGFRGTAAIMGVISLHSIVGMLLMFSGKQYAKKNNRLVCAEKVCEIKQSHEVAVSNSHSTINVTHMSSKTKWSSLETVKKESDTDMFLLIKTLKRVASMSRVEGEIRKRASFPISTQECSARDMLPLSSSQRLKKRSWEAQVNDKKVQEEEQYDKQNTEKDQKEIKYKKILTELFDMSLIKNYSFLNLCFGVSFACLADDYFFSAYPLIITNMGYIKSDVSLTLMYNGIAEVVSRILLLILTFNKDVKPKYLFFGAMVVMLFAKLGFLLYEHFVIHTLTNVFIMTAIIGVVRSWLIVPQFLVIIDNVRREKIASAYGIYAIINCLVVLVIGSIVGQVKDSTGSFKMCQVFLLVVNGAFIIPWILQFYFVDFKNRQTQRTQEITTESSSIICI